MENGRNQLFHRMWVMCALAASLMGSPVLAAGSDREAVYQSARQLLAADKAIQAYELLSKYELEWSGEDAFDYLLGIAALDGGEPGESIFALQRLVTRKPNFAGARMELARAYYDIGDNELARTEFEQIIADDPPAKVVSAVSEYMAAIDSRARAYSADTRFYFDVGFGYDSNAPAATAEDIFLAFKLADNNLEQPSAFGQLAIGAMYNRPITPDSQLLLNLRIDHRSNHLAHFIDPTNVDLGIGWNWKFGRNNLSVATNFVASAMEHEQNKNSAGMTVSFLHRFSDAWSLSSFVRAGALRFKEEILAVRDVDQLMYGISLNQTFSGALMNISITGNSDDAKLPDSTFSTKGYGIRVANSWFRRGGTVYFIEASASKTEYEEQFFEMDREEDVYTAGMGVTRSRFPFSDWATTFRINYSEKISTVSLYEFERFEAGASFRKVF